MNEHISKQLILLENQFSIEEIVLPKNKTLHLQLTLGLNTFIYCIHSAGIVYPLDDKLKLLDNTPIVSGEIYKFPDNAKAFLLESLNTSDQDLKILKIVAKE